VETPKAAARAAKPKQSKTAGARAKSSTKGTKAAGTIRKTGTKAVPLAGPAAKANEEPPARRTSEILQKILDENPQELISVEQIVKELGSTSFGTSLMVFSIPEVIPIPVPGMSAIVALPAGVIAAQMVTGRGEMRLPKAFLRRAVPRKAFAAAVKAIMPSLKKAEKGVRPRWQWASTKMAKRFLGMLIILLCGTMALPIPMTNMPLAIAIFLIGLGLVERDGKMIMAGVVLGIASIALIGGAFLGLFTLFGGTL